MAISDQLTLLNNTKTAIRTAINQKGGSVESSTPFADYATAITNLPSGGSGNPLIESIDVSDFTGTTFNDARTYITDVTIPSGVTSIGNSAFSRCTSITSVNIPSGVTSLGHYAFQNCSALTSITIPSGVTSIGGSAFYGCTSLTGNITVPQITIEYDIPDSNTSIFRDCQNITSVTLTEGQTVLPNFMFNGCTRLASISIPSTVTKIGSNVFSSTAITGVVTIPSGVTEIGSQCFNECPNITALVLLPTTPPYKQYASSILGRSSYPIYVPAESVDAYKAADNWRNYASRIYPIQQVATVDGNPVYNYDLGMTSTDTITSENMEKMPTGTSLEIAEGLTNIAAGEINYQEVTLPSTFTGFGDSDMIGSNVTTITSNAVTPPSAFRNQLGGSGLTAIYVPSASVDTYKAHAAWSGFASIIQAIPTE